MTDDHSTNTSHRRTLLKQFAAGLTLTSLAGCTNNQNGDPPVGNGTETANTDTLPDGTPSETPTDTPPDQTRSDTPEQTTTERPPEETPTPTPEAILQLEKMKEPELPGVWSSEDSLEDFETVLQVTAQTQNSTPVGETTVEDDDNEQIDSWPGNTPTLQETTEQTVAEMNTEGENTYTARNQKHDLKDTETVEIQEPDNFILDLQPANTENSNSPVFTTYSSHEELTHDKKEIDLNELENWHDNDYSNLKEDHPEMETFVEGVTDENKLTDVKQIREEDTDLPVLYPNWQESEYYGGHFGKETYEEASSAGEALDQLHPLLINFEERNTSDGAISTEDEQYAAVIQECFDQYNDNFNAHVWSFDLEYSGGGTHGNGFVYDTTNDKLRILETVESPATYDLEDGGNQYHPLVGDSRQQLPRTRTQSIRRLLAPTPIRRNQPRSRLRRLRRCKNWSLSNV